MLMQYYFYSGHTTISVLEVYFMIGSIVKPIPGFVNTGYDVLN